MKEYFIYLAAILGVGIVFIILWLAGAFVSLGFYPWYIHQQTEIIHNSNSYATTQREMIDQYIRAYGDADLSGQRAAIVNQVCDSADQISNFLTPYEASFVSLHCAGQ